MLELTDQGRRSVDDIAAKHGVSVGAATEVLRALDAGLGTQAQFSHPELGGMGQWSRGGMTMIGDMFNNALKAKVDALCADLAGMMSRGGAFVAPSQDGSGKSGAWWPEGLGAPASSGAQNDMRYAVFPQARRLVVDDGGTVTVYDLGNRRISGVSQQQSADRTLGFTGPDGPVRLTDLGIVEGTAGSGGAEQAAPAPLFPASDRRPAPAAPDPAAPTKETDIIATIERLAGLRDKGVLSDGEFQTKKAELLSRL